MILVLLALQLVLGFQLQAVQAVASPVSMQMPASMRMSMSTHTAMAADTPVSHARVFTTSSTDETATDAATQPDCPEHSMPHDCCHANACQCHCVYTPGAIDLPMLSNIATSVAVPSLAATQFIAPRIDEVLRPPIA